ncbi:MAG: hypothetical protein AAF747_03225, partial [Planctomycetota bacterium]
FVEAVSPRVVMQSTGNRRVGDERWDRVRARTEAWLTTATRGWSWVEVRSDAVRHGSMHVP